MSAARPPKPTGVRPTGAASKPSATALRKLARAHADAALQALADVASKGSSEASRISAANALLDRGYGKSGTAAADGAGRAPTLYQRIELIDGIPDSTDGKD